MSIENTTGHYKSQALNTKLAKAKEWLKSRKEDKAGEGRTGVAGMEWMCTNIEHAAGGTGAGCRGPQGAGA